MTTRVLIRVPHGNHLAAEIVQRNPQAPSTPTHGSVFDHGRGAVFYVHSASELVIREVERPAGDLAAERTLTRGEKLAGVSFNPSGDPFVSEAKDGYAARFDEIEALAHGCTDPDKIAMFTAAKQHLMAAQMLVVKAITWRG